MNSRPLPFPLDYSVTDSALTPIGEELPALPQFPPDSDEKIALVFEMSLNEFVKLASAIDVGSDIAYPEDSVGIWYLWARAIMSDNLCTLVAACIANPSSPTYAALRQFISQASNLELISNGLRALERGKTCYCPGMSEENINQPLGTETNPTCNLDVLWGQCQAVIEFLDTTGRDALEIIATWQQGAERLAGALRSIPLLETLPLDEIFGLPAWLAEEGLQYYDAGSTLANKLLWACELFCLCRDDCQITVRRVADSLNATFGITWIPDDVFDFLGIVANVITAGVGASFTWPAFMGLVIGSAAGASDFFGATLSWQLINLIVANGAEGASSGWNACACVAPVTPNWVAWLDRFSPPITQSQCYSLLDQDGFSGYVVSAFSTIEGVAGHRIVIICNRPVTVTDFLLTQNPVGAVNLWGNGNIDNSRPIEVGDVLDRISFFSPSGLIEINWSWT